MLLSNMTIEEMIKLIAISNKLEDIAIYKDIGAGAPRNPDKTINIIEYIDWIIKNGSY